MKNTLNQLIHVAANYFKVEPSLLDGSSDFFEKLNINSLQALNLLSELEKEFGVEIPDYELQDVRTFDALAELIDERK